MKLILPTRFHKRNQQLNIADCRPWTNKIAMIIIALYNLITIFYNLIMMLLHARDNNIQSFAYTWLHKGNQNEFLKHPKIKW